MWVVGQESIEWEKEWENKEKLFWLDLGRRELKAHKGTPFLCALMGMFDGTL